MFIPMHQTFVNAKGGSLSSNPEILISTSCTGHKEQQLLTMICQGRKLNHPRQLGEKLWQDKPRKKY